MAHESRIDDLRRRVEQDPASIAFARLAEEYRRAGQLGEAVDTCRAGLRTHPGFLSARVTLGRALLALGRLDEASHELGLVIASDPSNLAAARALAEATRRQGRPGDALTRYAAALALAPNDPDLERIVRDLRHELSAPRHDDDPRERVRALATIAALEKWLEAIDAARTDGDA